MYNNTNLNQTSANIGSLGNCVSPYFFANNFYLSQTTLISPTPFANYSTPYSTPTSKNFHDCSASSGYASETTFNSPFQAPTQNSHYYGNVQAPQQQHNQTSRRQINSNPSFYQATEPTTTVVTTTSRAEANDFSLDDILNSIKRPDEYSDSENYEFDSSDVSEMNGNKKKRILNQSQRVAANIRERKRMTIMNDAFVDLRQVLPIKTGKKRRKMSRLDIVIGAMEYIEYLDSILENKPAVQQTSSVFNGYYD
jgi:hypothetical protein